MRTEIKQHKNGQINIVFQESQMKMDGQQNLKVDHQNFHMIQEKLSSFVGLDHIKTTIQEIYAMHLINERRGKLGLKTAHQVLHMLFKGNPGTGKTTLARKLAEIYYELNILSKGHFIEAERADLVGEYIGQTAQKTRNMLEKALGGILFIDEAYSLARGGEKDFGREAIDTLVAHMENNHENLIIILAGYPYEMDYFLQLNPGLQSRFPFIFDFEDFTIDQLMKIAKQMFQDRDYEMSVHAEWKLRSHLYGEMKQKRENFANARYIRNIIEQSIRLHAVRVLAEQDFSFDRMMQITEDDITLKVER